MEDDIVDSVISDDEGIDSQDDSSVDLTGRIDNLNISSSKKIQIGHNLNIYIDGKKVSGEFLEALSKCKVNITGSQPGTDTDKPNDENIKSSVNSGNTSYETVTVDSTESFQISTSLTSTAQQGLVETENVEVDGNMIRANDEDSHSSVKCIDTCDQTLEVDSIETVHLSTNESHLFIDEHLAVDGQTKNNKHLHINIPRRQRQEIVATESLPTPLLLTPQHFIKSRAGSDSLLTEPKIDKQRYASECSSSFNPDGHVPSASMRHNQSLQRPLDINDRYPFSPESNTENYDRYKRCDLPSDRSSGKFSHEIDESDVSFKECNKQLAPVDSKTSSGMFVDTQNVKSRIASCINKETWKKLPTCYKEVNGYILGIMDCCHYESEHGIMVEVPNGMNYRLIIGNRHPQRCNIDLFIDGKLVAEIQLNEFQEDFVLTGPVEKDLNIRQKFVFLRARDAPEEAEIDPFSSENGVIEAIFKPQKSSDPATRSLKDMILKTYEAMSTPIAKKTGNLILSSLTSFHQGIQESSSTSRSLRSTAPAVWCAGASALQQSSETSGDYKVAEDIEIDEEKTVILRLRMVARKTDKSNPSNAKITPLFEVRKPPPLPL